MSSPTLPPMPVTAALQPGATGTATATIPNPPPALMARYHPDQLLKVHVLDHLGRNQLQVQTPQGPMILKTAFSAPAGTQLALKLTQTPLGIVATILSGPRAAAALAAQTSPSTPPQPIASPSLSVQSGAPMTGRSPTVADRAAPPQNTGHAVQAGQTAPIRSGPTKMPATVGTVLTAILRQPAVGSNLPAGSALAVTILSLSGTPPPSAATGKVIAHTPNGQTLLATRQGVLALNTKVPIPNGTLLGVNISPAPAQMSPPPTAVLQLTALGEAAQLTHHWQGLAEAVATLKSVDPAIARQLLNNLPTAGPKLTTTMLAVLNLFNVNSPGGIANLIGERALQILERASGKAATEKLDADFSTIKTFATEPNGDGWRIYALPIHYKGEIEQLRLGMRSGTDDEEDDEDGERGIRLLLDMGLSSLGRVQLDGLVKQRKRHFDLILRTQTPLPRMMQADIIALFKEAKEIGGLKGQLVFQGNPNRFLPMPGIDDKTPGTAGLNV